MDFRVRTFAGEAESRFGFLCQEHGFAGPLVISDDGGLYPVLRRLRYDRPGVAVEVSLVLSYMGEEYVAADLVTEDSPGPARRTGLGQITAHTGYQMRRALDRQAAAVRAALIARAKPEAS